MESNRFMLKCTSICLETTHQKLESQRVYLTLLIMNLHVIFRVNICVHAVGVVSTIQENHASYNVRFCCVTT